MSTFRILDQAPVYFDLSGQLAVDGSLKFYASGTTTPKDVYADPSMIVDNGSSILIGVDGRAVDQIWGNGTYRVRLYDVNSTLVFEADDVEIPGGTGTTIPSLITGNFLTNDGAVLAWSPILQVPDPTGSASKVLSNDGTNLIWSAAVTLPPIPTGGITQSGSSIVIGAVRLQWGSGTLPASGTNTTNVSITFGTAFSASPVSVQLTAVASSGVTGSGGLLILSAPSQTSTGFNAWGDTNAGFSGGSHPITATTPFTWLAIGPA